MIARRLARGVGRVRTVRRGFRERGIGRAERAIDLVGRDVQEARVVAPRSRASVERGLQQGERAEHVGLQECFRVDDRAVDMGFGGEMHDARETVFVKQAAHQIGVTDIALTKTMLRSAIRGSRLRMLAA